MKRGLVAATCCFLLAVIGWNIWNAYFLPYGEDKFDDAFYDEFDPAHIIDNIDVLISSGQFECNHIESMGIQRVLWPLGSTIRNEYPACIMVQKDTTGQQAFEEYYIIYPNGNIYWEKTDYLLEGKKGWEELYERTTIDSDAILSEYKYLYDFIFYTPDGAISYTQLGNSRKECMDIAHDTLIWLMSIS